MVNYSSLIMIFLDINFFNNFRCPFKVPWMLALWIRTGEPGKDIPTCGAALISSEYAVTAAHCVGNKNTNFFLRQVFVCNTYPEWYFQILFVINCRGGSNFNHLNGKSLEIEISHIITHPSFNPFNFEFDIALIKFRWPITFTRNLFPVCLPPPPATAFPNEEILTDYTGAMKHFYSGPPLLTTYHFSLFSFLQPLWSRASNSNKS